MKEWYRAQELADFRLPGLPNSRRGIDRLADLDGWRMRSTRSGKPLWRKEGRTVEYSIKLLPLEAQMELANRARVEATAAPAPMKRRKDSRWDWFARQPLAKKEEAKRRLAILEAVQLLWKSGQSKRFAIETVARQEGMKERAIWNWFKMVAGQDESDWLCYLTPMPKGRKGRQPIPKTAFELYKSDYLRLERPAAEACYRRVQAWAAENAIDIPCGRTFERHLEDQVPEEVRTLLRDGPEALERMYPYQERDRSVFHALEAVTADGHKADVMVQWSDDPADVSRPQIVAIQDLYSGKILAWRIGKTLTSASVRLAFHDVFRDFGIPDHVYVDNGREFASKLISGGAETRYRFKVKPEEPLGILKMFGIEIHWTTPYHGQSKPIERAFRDWAGDMAKDPRLAGAYTGNSPMNKPANYGAKAAPIDLFMEVLEEYVVEANKRPGRRTKVCAGLHSFDTVFNASYRDAPIRRASKEQLRMAMLAAEHVTCRKPDGSIMIHGSRFWDQCLIPHIGHKVTVRFDPENVTAGAAVYRSDGVKIGEVDCLEAVGFNNVEAAKEHARQRRAWMKKTKEAADIMAAMTPEDVAEMLPAVEAQERVRQPKVVRMVNMSRYAPEITFGEEDEVAAQDRIFRENFRKGLQLIRDGDEP